MIFLTLREISHEASTTSWLFFPRFSSLFNYCYYLKCSYQMKIKNNNKSKRPQYVWYAGIFPSQEKCTMLRRQNLLQSSKDVHKSLWKTMKNYCVKVKILLDIESVYETGPNGCSHNWCARRKEAVRRMGRTHREISSAQENVNCKHMTVGCKINDRCVFWKGTSSIIGGISNKLEGHQNGLLVNAFSNMHIYYRK